MNGSEPHERLAAARIEAGYATASEAARAYGWNENTYRSHENGERGLKRSVAEKYARAFGVSAAYLMMGERHKSNLLPSVEIPISGSVTSDGRAKIVSLNVKPAQIEAYAILPASFYTEVIALEMIGDELFNFISEGDLIILNKKLADPNLKQGHLCYIEDVEGHGYLRFLRNASRPGTVDIQMSPRMPEHPVSPEVIASVAAIIPRGEWRRMRRAEHVDTGREAEES